jgi:hypothetical protein
MGKTGVDFDAESYAPVAERIRLFYEKHPDGRIETELVRRTVKEVVFKALVFRTPTDERPAATGWAAEREGDGDINLVACLENTETSAVGRALANLGFTASRHRPSAEEMQKVSRTRARLAGERTLGPGERVARAPVVLEPSSMPTDLERTTCVEDLLALISRAERLGLRPARAQRWRAAVSSGELSATELARREQRLRIWVDQESRVALF